MLIFNSAIKQTSKSTSNGMVGSKLRLIFLRAFLEGLGEAATAWVVFALFINGALDMSC
jgi:hypothetical protein